MILNFEKDYLDFLQAIQEKPLIINREALLSLLDLTLLEASASLDDLTKLKDKANQFGVAAICVLPEHLYLFHPLKKSKRATVINFPHGLDPLKITLKQAEQAINNDAEEIDYVFPYQFYLNGETHLALSHCDELYKFCSANNVIFKVILETGAFPKSENIYQLSKMLLNQGCDFLKTSTGKIKIGATPIAVLSMLKAISDTGINGGIKVAGSVKTVEQALLYLNLATYFFNRPIDKSWFRLGASSLLEEILKTANNSVSINY